MKGSWGWRGSTKTTWGGMWRLARVTGTDSATELTVDWWASQSEDRALIKSKVWLMGCSLQGLFVCLSKAFVVLLVYCCRVAFVIFLFFGFSGVERFCLFLGFMVTRFCDLRGLLIIILRELSV